MKVKVENLIVEVTRQCNMTCNHCLRGDSEWDNANYDIIPKIFDGIDEITRLTFSGGEPTLNVPYIRECVDYIIENNIIVNGCFIATNGKKYSQELVDCVRDLFAAKYEREYGNREMAGVGDDCVMRFSIVDSMFEEERDMFSIAVSMDNFHEPIEIKEWLKWKTCGFYSDVKVNVGKNALKPMAIGRAEGLPPNQTEKFQKDINVSYEVEDEDVIWGSDLYVACTGSVYNCCDFSYFYMEQYEPFVILARHSGTIKTAIENYVASKNE